MGREVPVEISFWGKDMEGRTVAYGLSSSCRSSLFSPIPVQIGSLIPLMNYTNQNVTLAVPAKPQGGMGVSGNSPIIKLQGNPSNLPVSQFPRL